MIKSLTLSLYKIEIQNLLVGVVVVVVQEVVAVEVGGVKFSRAGRFNNFERMLNGSKLIHKSLCSVEVGQAVAVGVVAVAMAIKSQRFLVLLFSF